MSYHQNNKHSISRYPKTENRSLKAWNAADEHILRHFEPLKNVEQLSIAIYNDRFGFLTSYLSKISPKTTINYASQKKAILKNLEANQIPSNDLQFSYPLDASSAEINLAILKIPKSMDLFKLQLSQISKSLDSNGTVLCGFMTKYFTPQILSIAGEFFEIVQQSKAWKKSRLLTLKDLKPYKERQIVNSIKYEDQIFRQYYGVFSARHIDDASQLFMKNLKIKTGTKRILDLASGNGFLAKMIRLKNAVCEIHLLDDDWLAVESSKLNFEQDDQNTFFHFNDSLEDFEDDFFDLIVCNPPFHFEHETNIEVAIELFRQAKRCLNENGSFQLVANRHLNYKTHLHKLFDRVDLLSRKKKFEIYECGFSVSRG